VKKDNLLPPFSPRTVSATGAVVPAVPVAPAPLIRSRSRWFIWHRFLLHLEPNLQIQILSFVNERFYNKILSFVGD
jgi:hypothetical protein